MRGAALHKPALPARANVRLHASWLHHLAVLDSGIHQPMSQALAALQSSASRRPLLYGASLAAGVVMLMMQTYLVLRESSVAAVLSTMSKLSTSLTSAEPPGRRSARSGEDYGHAVRCAACPGQRVACGPDSRCAWCHRLVAARLKTQGVQRQVRAMSRTSERSKHSRLSTAASSCTLRWPQSSSPGMCMLQCKAAQLCQLCLTLAGCSAYQDMPLSLLGDWRATISAPHMHASCMELLAAARQPGVRKQSLVLH